MSNRLAAILDRPIAFHRPFVKLTGSVTAALMLSQAMYWHNRTDDLDGWFYKTQAEWEEETGMTRHEQDRARATLRATPFWHEERRGLPAKLYYRVDTNALLDALMEKTPPATLDDVLSDQAQILKSLSKVGYMRAKKAGVQAESTDYAEVLRTKGMICGICNQPITRGIGQGDEHLAFDHIIPIAQGGPHTLDNLQPAHSYCNHAKGDGFESKQECFDKENKFAYPKQTGTLAQSKQDRPRKADRSASDKQTFYIAESTTETTTEREGAIAPARPPTAPPIDLSLPNPPTEEEMAQQPAEDAGAAPVKVVKYRHASRYANGPHMKGAQLAGEYVGAGTGANPVQIYHERYAIDEFPLTHPQQDDLIAIVTDLTRWRSTVIQWSQTSYNPKNIRGQLDWYHNGTPTHQTESRNHANNQGTGSNGRPRPHWADYDPKQTEYNPDRAAVLAGWSDEEDIDDYAEYKKQLAAQQTAAA